MINNYIAPIKKIKENPFVVMFLIPIFIFVIWILILNYFATTYKNNDNIKTESHIKEYKHE